MVNYALLGWHYALLARLLCWYNWWSEFVKTVLKDIKLGFYYVSFTIFRQVRFQFLYLVYTALMAIASRKIILRLFQSLRQPPEEIVVASEGFAFISLLREYSWSLVVTSLSFVQETNFITTCWKGCLHLGEY